MDFNLDDPLGDLISDNSQDDSFFETSKKSKPPQRTKETPEKKSTSKKMEDLFGVTKSSEAKPAPANPEPALPKRPVISSPIVTKSNTSVNKSDLFNDDDDIISDLGFNPRKPKSASKINILDDLLAPTERKPSTPIIARPPTSSSNDAKRIVSRQSTETTDTSAFATARPKTARRVSLTSTDPLGIFGASSTASTKLIEQASETAKVRRKGSTADWLGLDAKEEPIKPEASSNLKSNTEIRAMTPDSNVRSVFPAQQVSQTQFIMGQMQQQQQGALLMATSLETQNAMQTLQQQETQIMIATQMKNQEMALMEMQKRQQELLEHQEAQFNDLLQKQIIRQNQLEMTIKSQQERINAHIQLLMTHPSLVSDMVKVENSTKKSNKDTAEDTDAKVDDIQLEYEVKRLELEKLRLEELVSNINANHEKELEFLENSYKKQIQVLQDSLSSIETRLQDEIKYIETFYSKKVDNLQLDNSKLLEEFETKIKKIGTENNQAITDLKLQHENTLDSLKNDYQKMIENIRQSKLLEFSVVQENSSYLQTLRNASDHLENVSGDLQTLRDEMNSKIDFEVRQKEVNFVAREKKIEDAEKRLKLSEESTEREKSRLIELVTTLEIQLAQLSKDSSDEKWNYRQQLFALDTEKSVFEKEKQFAREQTEREQKQLAELKDSQLEDYQKLKQKIFEERQQLDLERAKLETSKKLELSSDFSKSKVEIETSLKVAQDATRQADLEREKYFKMQRELEMRKRQIIDRENENDQKKDELENSISSAKAKEKQLQEELRKYRLVEQSFNNKIQILQNQMRQIAERESHLSQERLILSKERLEMQEFKKKLEQNKCSLCKIGERSNEISNILTGNDMIRSYNTINDTNDSLGFRNNVIDRLFDNDVNESLLRLRQINLSNKIENDEIIDPDLQKISLVHLRNSVLPTGVNFLDPDFADLNIFQNTKEVE